MSRAELLHGDPQAIDVALRDGVIELQVPETPTTGYRWALAPASESLVQLVDSTFDAAATSMPGAPGRRRLRLRLHDEAQEGVIELRLVRSWQPDEPADSIAVRVVP